MYTVGKKYTPEEAAEFNKSQYDSRLKYGGCIGSRICDGCNHLISDSICLCSGSFTCPNCGRKNGVDVNFIIPEVKNDIPLWGNGYSPLGYMGDGPAHFNSQTIKFKNFELEELRNKILSIINDSDPTFTEELKLTEIHELVK